MVGLPTLLESGSLHKPKSDEIPIKFIIKWFNRKKSTNNRVLILVSETGSGKSTTLPVELHREFFQKERKNIIITQPRVLTAIDISRSIPQESWARDMVYGKNIGVSTGGLKQPPVKGIIFTSIGILTQQLKNNTDTWICERYSFIIVDECHIKPIELDIGLLMLKRFISHNKDKPECPFIIFMSATFRHQAYAKYFGVDDDNIIIVKGRSFPVENHWLNICSPNLAISCLNTIVKIHMQNPQDDPDKCDILVFLPGKFEIMYLASKLNKSEIGKEIAILQIDGTAVLKKTRDYQILNKPVNKIAPQLKRKVILTTNVAETGLTLDYLKYCVDSCYQRTSEFVPVYGLNALVTKAIEQSMSHQRRGRVGRKFPGEYYPMCTEQIYNKLIKDQIPEIYKTDLCRVILSEVENYMGLDLLDPPSTDSIKHALNKLYCLGCITYSADAKPIITEMGQIVNKLLFIHHDEIRVELVRMVLCGFAFNTNVVDLATIAAFASFKSVMPDNAEKQFAILRDVLPPFFICDTPEQTIYKFKIIICDDLIEPLFFFKAALDNLRTLKEWCVQNEINYSLLLEILGARDEIIDQFLGVGIDVFAPGPSLYSALEDDFMEELAKIKRCIYEGFKMNLVQWDGRNYKHPQYDYIAYPPNKSKQWKKIAELFDNGVVIPKNIVPCELLVKQNLNSPLYSVQCSKYSVMDGFVVPDESLMY